MYPMRCKDFVELVQLNLLCYLRLLVRMVLFRHFLQGRGCICLSQKLGLGCKVCRLRMVFVLRLCSLPIFCICCRRGRLRCRLCNLQLRGGWSGGLRRINCLCRGYFCRVCLQVMFVYRLNLLQFFRFQVFQVLLL